MPLPADRLPDDMRSLPTRVARLERELRELRAARNLEHASIDSGALTVRDDSGKTATLGTTYTGDLQTSASGQRVVVTSSDTSGLPAVEFYSGLATETAPGEVSTRVATGSRPAMLLDAPTTATDTSTNAFAQLKSGDQTGLTGLFEVSTGNGSGSATYVTGTAANSTAPGQAVTHVDDPTTSSYGELTVDADGVTFTGTSGSKGFSYNSSGTNDTFNVTGKLTSSLGQFDEEGPWQDPSYPVGGYWTVTTSTTYQHCRYSAGSKRARLDGVVQCATSYSTGGQTVFTLPVGYRPLKAHYYGAPVPVSGSPTEYGLRVGSDGVVTLYTSTAISVGSFIDLSGISWPLD